MKVLHLFDNFSGNGTERVLESIIPHLLDLGVELTVVALNSATLRWGELERYGISRYTPDTHFSPLRFYASRRFTEWSFLDGIIKTEMPDLIHGHFTFSQMVAATLSKRYSIPYIITYHMGCAPRDNMSMRNQLIFSKIQDRAFRDARLVVAVSPETQKMLNGFGYRNTCVLENPLPDTLIAWQLSFKKVFDLCFCGRLTPDKAPITTLQLSRQLKDLGKPIRTAIVGSGYLSQELQEYANEHRLDVTFFGHVSHEKCIDILASSRSFHSPSLFEAFGLSSLEAIAVGCFCLLNDIPVYRRFAELFDGVAVIPNKDVNIMADMLATIIEKEPMTYNRNLIRYSPQAYAAKLVKCYQHILNS